MLLFQPDGMMEKWRKAGLFLSSIFCDFLTWEGIRICAFGFIGQRVPIYIRDLALIYVNRPHVSRNHSCPSLVNISRWRIRQLKTQTRTLTKPFTMLRLLCVPLWIFMYPKEHSPWRQPTTPLSAGLGVNNMVLKYLTVVIFTEVGTSLFKIVRIQSCNTWEITLAGKHCLNIPPCEKEWQNTKQTSQGKAEGEVY